MRNIRWQKMALRAANGLLDGVTALLVLLAVVWSGYALWDNSRVYAAADNVQAGLLAFKPQPQEDNSLSFGQLRDINPDVCGWLTLDGTAIDSCIYLGVWAQGKSILTVEGLQDADGGLSPIQRAFVEEAAVQCGFCTPGIIMSAVEIVGSGKQYTREELRKLISGHLCRCTGYQNILNAVERAVNEAHRFVGKGE